MAESLLWPSCHLPGPAFAFQHPSAAFCVNTSPPPLWLFYNIHQNSSKWVEEARVLQHDMLMGKAAGGCAEIQITFITQLNLMGFCWGFCLFCFVCLIFSDKKWWKITDYKPSKNNKKTKKKRKLRCTTVPVLSQSLYKGSWGGLRSFVLDGS